MRFWLSVVVLARPVDWAMLYVPWFCLGFSASRLCRIASEERWLSLAVTTPLVATLAVVAVAAAYGFLWLD